METSLLVSYKKSKNFHPSKVKLRTTHYKTLLVPSDPNDPAAVVKIDRFKIESTSFGPEPTNHSENRNTFDYTVKEVKRKALGLHEVKCRGFGWRANVDFEKYQAYSGRESEFNVSLVFLDYFSGKQVSPTIRLSQEEAKDVASKCAFEMLMLSDRKMRDFQVTETGMEFSCVAGESRKLSISLGPGRNEQTVPVDLLVGLFSPSPWLTYPVEGGVRDYFELAKSSPLDLLLQQDASWMNHMFHETNRAVDSWDQATIDKFMLILWRFVQYLSPYIFFIVDVVLELISDPVQSYLAQILKDRYLNLDKVAGDPKLLQKSILTAICTDWVTLLAMIYQPNKQMIDIHAQEKRNKFPEQADRLLKIKYPLLLRELMMRQIAEKTLSTILLKEDQPIVSQVYRSNEYSVWMEDNYLFKWIEHSTGKTYTLKNVDRFTKLGEPFFRDCRRIQLEIFGDEVYYFDRTLQVINLIQVKSAIDNAPESEDISLQEHSRTVADEFLAKYRNMRGWFFIASNIVGHVFDHGGSLISRTLLTWMHRNKPSKVQKPELLDIAYTLDLKITIQGIVAIYWAGSVLHLNMTCKELSSGGKASVLLVAFRYDPTANSMSLLTSEILPASQFRLYSLPVSTLETYDSWVLQNTFLKVRNRIFSLSFLDRLRLCMFIHCFHRNKYLRIGGSNCGTPGLYCLRTDRRYVLDAQSRRQVGVYGVEQTGEDEKGGHMYRMFRYYLRF